MQTRQGFLLKMSEKLYIAIHVGDFQQETHRHMIVTGFCFLPPT